MVFVVMSMFWKTFQRYFSNHDGRKNNRLHGCSSNKQEKQTAWGRRWWSVSNQCWRSFHSETCENFLDLLSSENFVLLVSEVEIYNCRTREDFHHNFAILAEYPEYQKFWEYQNLYQNTFDGSATVAVPLRYLMQQLPGESPAEIFQCYNSRSSFRDA